MRCVCFLIAVRCERNAIRVREPIGIFATRAQRHEVAQRNIPGVRYARSQIVLKKNSLAPLRPCGDVHQLRLFIQNESAAPHFTAEQPRISPQLFAALTNGIAQDIQARGFIYYEC